MRERRKQEEDKNEAGRRERKQGEEKGSGERERRQLTLGANSGHVTAAVSTGVTVVVTETVCRVPGTVACLTTVGIVTT